MESSKQAILGGIHNAYTLRRKTDRRRDDASYDSIPREYHSTGLLGDSERIELFEHRLKEYDTGVHYASVENIANAVMTIITARQKRRIVIPDGLPPAWRPNDLDCKIGDELTAAELDHFDGVLTGCTVAIAMTGSIVLQNRAGQGPRRLTLIPDYHLCIVFADQIVETVPEAFDRLAQTATLPTTFISGPSATADIEMTRIKGVHGPRFLDVLIVGNQQAILSRQTERTTL